MDALVWGRKRGGSVPVLRDDAVVASIWPSHLRERAEAEVDARHWSYARRSRALRATLTPEPEPRMVATRPSMMRQAWDIRTDRATYRIEPMGLLQSGYRVLRDGAQVGTSARAGFWSSRPTLEVDSSVSADEQVFLLWVAYIMRRRGGAAASSAGAAS